MSVRWEVKKGNTSVQNILVKDKNDNIVTNFGDATEIKFQIKKTKKAVVLVEKTVALGGIVINEPTTGFLEITLTPTDTGTTLSVGDYFMGLQITWHPGGIDDPDIIYEVNMEIDNTKTDRFRIKQDIV